MSIADVCIRRPDDLAHARLRSRGSSWLRGLAERVPTAPNGRKRA